MQAYWKSNNKSNCFIKNIATKQHQLLFIIINIIYDRDKKYEFISNVTILKLK